MLTLDGPLRTAAAALGIEVLAVKGVNLKLSRSDILAAVRESRERAGGG